MKAMQLGLFKHFNRQQIEFEIEEELRFHLELLTKEHLQQDLSLAEAKDAARKRFGNVEQIKDQCIEISRRHQPLSLALKSFLILVFLVGVLLRVFSSELHVTRVGVVLIAVGILGRLLVHVRGLHPSSFRSQPETSSPLMLREGSQSSVTGYDQRKRTPVERVISDQ